MHGEITASRQEQAPPARAPSSPFPHRAGVVALEPGGVPVTRAEEPGGAGGTDGCVPPDGGVHFRMAVPAWLRGAGAGLTTGALAVLAEATLRSAAAQSAEGEVLPASLRLETHGEWPHPPVPIPVADVALGGPVSPTTPRIPPGRGAAPPTAPRPQAVRSSDGPAVAGSTEGGDGLLLHARAWTPVEGSPSPVADGRLRIPRPAVRRVAGAITAADGRVLAVMTAACSIVAVTTAPGREPMVGTGAAAGELATVPSAHPAATPSGAAADHPLLAMLAATVRVDGDRAWARFHPEAWLADLVGAVHGGAGCAVADAAVSAALGSVLPAGSATQVMSMDVTFVRSLSLDREVETTVEVRHVGRRLAVVDAEIGTLGARPSILARFLVSRTTLR